MRPWGHWALGAAGGGALLPPLASELSPAWRPHAAMVTEYTRPARWMPACGLVGEKRCSSPGSHPGSRCGGTWAAGLGRQGRGGQQSHSGSGGETLPTHYPSSAVSHRRRGRGCTSALPQTSTAHETVPPAWSSQVPAGSPLPQELDREPRPTWGPIPEDRKSVV